MGIIIDRVYSKIHYLNMKKKSFLPIILICLIFTIVSCISKINDDQLKVQQKLVGKLSSNIEKEINDLKNLVNPENPNYLPINKIRKKEAVNRILLLNENLELINSFSSKVNMKNFFARFPQKTNLKNKLIDSPKDQIFPTTNYKYLCLFNYLQQQKRYVVIELNSNDFFKNLSQIYFPRPYELLIIDNFQKILFSENYNLMGSDFVDLGGDDHQHNYKLLQREIRQNDVSYSMLEYNTKNGFVNELYCWQALRIDNSKLWIVLKREIPAKKKRKGEDIYLLSTLRSYAVKDTLIKTIIREEYNQTKNLVEEIYEKNPEIYSVQFADSTGRIIYGKPKANSIIGYSYKDKMFLDFDVNMRNAYLEGEMQVLTDTLPEGGEAEITFMPIEFDNRVIGILISTQLND